MLLAMSTSLIVTSTNRRTVLTYILYDDIFALETLFPCSCAIEMTRKSALVIIGQPKVIDEQLFASLLLGSHF